ncbi:MAG: hypothetical protein H0T46_23030 [Deltaproteobacteria bacterium]|nr:hypothetical protein [Deltaproteobacteria bacterium]
MDDEVWNIAGGVLRELSVYGVGLVVLGEVLPATLGRLAQNTPFELVSDPFMDTAAGIGALYDPSRVLVEFKANIDACLRNRDVTRAIGFTLRIASGPIVDIVGVHWPSRTIAENAMIRQSLGSGLQTHVTNLVDLGGDDAFVIVCGDFNDDPFDVSLTANLFGTRDRGLAKKQQRALYNPFWRLVGERKAHDSDPVHEAAGTHFWDSGTQTRWYTFDQFLFSSNFVNDGAWQLVESATEVWDRPPLAEDGGALHKGFDHYPVVVGIRSRIAGAPP